MRQPQLLVFSVSLLIGSTLFAQSARLGGRITDAQGGILPGVTVIATHTPTGLAREAVTNAAGSYLFPSLDPGTYRLDVTMAGFAPWSRLNILLVSGQGLTLDATLELGERLPGGDRPLSWMEVSSFLVTNA